MVVAVEAVKVSRHKINSTRSKRYKMIVNAVLTSVDLLLPSATAEGVEYTGTRACLLFGRLISF